MGKPRDLANVVATGNILADGAVAPAELTGVTSTAAEINILDGVTATAAELNLLDGVTATTTELNHVDGVTSNVQTQMDTKAPVASPTFTGTATAPTVNASTALQIGGTAITATAAELNKMDGVTVSASDINSVTTKAPTADPTFTGDASFGGDISITAATNAKLTINDNVGEVGSGNLAFQASNSAGSALKPMGFRAEDVRFATGASERFRFGSSGQLGIGGATYGTSGQVLTSGGSGAAPSWVDASGGGSAQFTASGSITAGDPVGITTSGAVKKLNPIFGANQNAALDVSQTNYMGVVYIGSNKIVVYYKHSSTELRAKVGTISGNSISYGSHVQVNSGTVRGDQIDIAYASNSGNVIFTWSDDGSNDKAYVRVGSISGTTITLGSSQVLASNAAAFNPKLVWDPDAQRGFVCYRESSIFQYSTFSLGGTGNRTITLLEDSQNLDGNHYMADAKLVYDTTADKIVCCFRDAQNNKLKYVAFEVSGSNYAQGTVLAASTDESAAAEHLYSLAFIPGINKVGLVYSPQNSSTYDQTFRAGTLTLSGSAPTTITKTEGEILSHSNINDYNYITLRSDGSGNCLITYDDDDSTLPDKIRAIVGSYSGNTFVPNVLSDFTISSGSNFAYPHFIHTDSTNDKFLMFSFFNSGQGDSTSGYVCNLIGSVDDLVAFNNWIGLSVDSVSNGATVNVTVQGGINESQSSLTVGAKQYLQNDATISTTLVDDRLIGISTAATKLFLTNGTIGIGPTGYNSN